MLARILLIVILGSLLGYVGARQAHELNIQLLLLGLWFAFTLLEVLWLSRGWIARQWSRVAFGLTSMQLELPPDVPVEGSRLSTNAMAVRLRATTMMLEEQDLDHHCVTAPDGTCISDDPRCMHQLKNSHEQNKA